MRIRNNPNHFYKSTEEEAAGGLFEGDLFSDTPALRESSIQPAVENDSDDDLGGGWDGMGGNSDRSRYVFYLPFFINRIALKALRKAILPARNPLRTSIALPLLIPPRILKVNLSLRTKDILSIFVDY